MVPQGDEGFSDDCKVRIKRLEEQMARGQDVSYDEFIEAVKAAGFTFTRRTEGGTELYSYDRGEIRFFRLTRVFYLLSARNKNGKALQHDLDEFIGFIYRSEHEKG